MGRLFVFIASAIVITPFAFAQQTRFVDDTGVDMGDCTDAENPCATIGFAIEQANSGDIIDIAAGTYTESITIDKDLALQGAGRDATIIQTHPVHRQATERVITVEGTDLELEITAVTIRHGVAIDESTNDQGGGIYVNESTLSLANATLADNEAVFGGGVYNENAPLALTDVLFDSNEADSLGGGLFTVESSPVLKRVQFVANRARAEGFFIGGAGMADERGTPILEDVTFELNVSAGMGGGMFCKSVSKPMLKNVAFRNNSAAIGGGMAGDGVVFASQCVPTLENVEFRGNLAQHAGGMFIGIVILAVGEAPPRLTNVLFLENGADSGGGLSIGSTEAVITNTTFSGNFALDCGAVRDSWDPNDDRVSFTNTIFWGNEAVFFGNEVCVSGEVEFVNTLYSDKPGDISVIRDGNLTVENSLTEDPLFVDPENGDLRLTENSPAIEAGDPDTDLALFPVNDEGDPIDLDGSLRVFGDGVDIGAYEHQGTISDEASPQELTEVLSAPSPNPAQNTTSFTLAVEQGQDVTVEVFDVTGRRVQTLYDGTLAAGMDETLTLDASSLPAGVYLIRATGEGFVKTRRVTVIR